METIIGLLFILLPIVFKLINRKFEQAGQTDTARQIKEIAEMFGADESQDELDEPVIFEPEIIEPVKPEPVEIKTPEVPQVHLWEAEATPVVRKSDVVRRKKPILEEDDSRKKREKIDPKKLIVYSEIMNRKF